MEGSNRLDGLRRLRLPGFGAIRERIGGRTVRNVAIAVAALLVVYYPVGMVWMHVIDDDPAFFAEAQVPPSQSRAVAMAAALIDREVNQHPWTSNDPFFLPSSMLDNMPNFQQGIVGGLARFAVEMRDQLGRTRGSSRVDPDLERAASLLQYAPNVWVWDPSVSWLPTATSEAQYNAAREALINYDKRLAAGQAAFDRRADNLQTTLDRIAADLGSWSAIIDDRIGDGSPILFDFTSDDIFYKTKGHLYAYALLLRELGKDYAGVIAERRIEAAWQQMLDAMFEAAELQPIMVLNGAPDSQVLPSHLASQGFYLLRARVQLREIVSILQS